MEAPRPWAGEQVLQVVPRQEWHHPHAVLSVRDVNRALLSVFQPLQPSDSALNSRHHPKRTDMQLAASLTYLASHGQVLGCLLQKREFDCSPTFCF